MRLRQEHGFTLVDILVAIALMAVVTAMALPMVDSSSRGFSMRGDAQALANLVSLAKMRASARFTRTRVRADLAGNSFRLEVWDRGAGTWVMEGDDVRLSRGVRFGFAALNDPPPNTQPAIAQSPACTGANSLTADLVADTSCIVFNSRGVPIDTTGAPVGANAFYVTDGSSVYATTITATPLIRQWWSNATNAAWIRR